MMEIQYPLEERIGDPDLFVGRTRELAEFGKWIDSIPRKRAKSRLILARRKSGKTVFMQRLFNQIWSENNLTIPFYFNIQEVKIWFPDFAIKYYKTFASHCISFLERDPTLPPNDIQQRLQELVKADLIKEGASDIRYKGLKDGTLNLVLRNRFQEEIKSFAPKFVEEFRDEVYKLKKDKKALLGKLSQIVGKTAELQLMTEFRSRKRFQLSTYFDGVSESDNPMLNIIYAASRFIIQRSDGKNMEIDVIAESDCGRVILVEAKKMSTPVGQNIVSDFLEKIDVYSLIYPEKIIIKAFFSLNGFTGEALKLCKTNQIAVTQRLKFLL